MARINILPKEALEKPAQAAYENHLEKGSLSNMKEALLQDYATYEAYMGWYTSFNRLLEIFGKKTAMIYAHSISTTNNCLLCSLFFINDLKALGLDPADLVLDEKEELLVELGRCIVIDPTSVSEEIFVKLRKHFSDKEIIAIVGFAGQMIATNNFNSVLQIDVDARLMPIINEFTPATWREK